MRNVLIYKNQDNLCSVFIYKMHDTLRYAIFHEIFEVGIYIQKSWKFALRDVFIYKILTLDKKQDNLRYIFIYKIRTLCVRNFSLNF